MSTSYYLLRRPITSVQPKVLGGHTHVGVWINHAWCGELVLRPDEWLVLLDSLTDHDSVVLRTSYGGNDAGIIVKELRSGLDDSVHIVSEYLDLCTVGEIRQRQTA